MNIEELYPTDEETTRAYNQAWGEIIHSTNPPNEAEAQTAGLNASTKFAVDNAVKKIDEELRLFQVIDGEFDFSNLGHSECRRMMRHHIWELRQALKELIKDEQLRHNQEV